MTTRWSNNISNNRTNLIPLSRRIHLFADLEKKEKEKKTLFLTEIVILPLPPPLLFLQFPTFFDFHGGKIRSSNIRVFSGGKRAKKEEEKWKGEARGCGTKGKREIKKKKKLTDSLVHGGIDHGAKLGEARLPHDVGGALHPFWRWYRKRGGLGPCQDSTVPAVSVWTGAGGPLGRSPP